MKSGQKGFTVIETLLVLILLAILGFTGYYVWHSQTTADKTLSTAAKTSSTAPPVKSTEFIFKGLGVQFNPKTDLKGLKYQISNGDYYLSDDAYVSAVNTCPDAQFRQSDLSGGGGFAAIGKTNGQYPKDANPLQYGILLKQFPNFWISYGFPNGSFCAPDTSINKSIYNTVSAEAKKFFDDFQKTATLAQ